MDKYKDSWPSDTSEDRYDNLIAFPEGGMGYDDEVLSVDALSYAFHRCARDTLSLLEALGSKATPEADETIAQLYATTPTGFARIQQTHAYTWGQIGDVLAKWQQDIIAQALWESPPTPSL